MKSKFLAIKYNARNSGKLGAPASNFSDCLRLLNFSINLAKQLGQNPTYGLDFVYT